MSKTTIAVTADTKRQLHRDKDMAETWDEYLQRLLETSKDLRTEAEA